MEYAVIETGGKQYRVNPGMELEIEKISNEGDALSFDRILLYVNDTQVNVGKPYLKDVLVTARILGDIRGDKIRVARFKAKSKYRKVRGHRQALSQIRIEKIVKTK